MTTAHFTFDNLFDDGSPRRFAGTYRPTADEARRILETMPAGEFNFFSTSYPANQASSFEEWALRQGRFDRALYHVEEWERR